LNNFLFKEIEEYGILRLTDSGKEFIDKPQKIEIPLNRDYTSEDSDNIITSQSGGSALDNKLLSLLKDLRKSEGKRLKLQPWIIFSEVALQDMATYYPISKEDMTKISGVSAGKAAKFSKPFIEIIKEYVEENDIVRPEDFVMKQVVNKSKSKVSIIQAIDRKLPLEDLAASLKISMEELLREMDMIVSSGTKLDINYYLNDNLDESVIEDIFEYFNEAESDSVEEAFKELEEDDFTLDEIQLVKIKFLSELAN
jgi:ATP-dependent DNA helicase RecQ